MKVIYQFGVKNFDVTTLGNMPRLDCRILPNPFIRGVSDEILKETVKKLPAFAGLVSEGVKLLETHNKLAIFCLYGKHRSGAVAEAVARITGAEIKII